MNSVPQQPKPDTPVPEKDASRDLKTFEALPAKKKALARLQEDPEKTSGRDAVDVRKKVKDEES